MSRQFSPTTMKGVEAALPVMDPGDGLTVLDVWKRLNLWNLSTVRAYLSEMVRQGKAESIWDGSGHARLYRKVA